MNGRNGTAARALSAFACIFVLLWTVLAVPRPLPDLGDRVQIALPVLGAACAAVRGDLGAYAGRFAGLMAAVHGSKAALGDIPMNRRPRGDGRGFPSGHTASAVYGASYLARECGALVPYAGPALGVAAAFVAGTRVESGRHSLVQTLAGALYALVFDLALRDPRSRASLAALLRRLARAAALAGQATVARLERRDHGEDPREAAEARRREPAGTA